MKNQQKLEKFKSKELKERVKIAEKHMLDNPKKYPVLLVNNMKNKEFKKIKFLVPKSFSAGKFIKLIKKFGAFRPEESIFLSVNQKILNTRILIGELYDKHKSEDKFLYLKVDEIQAFGFNQFN